MSNVLDQINKETLKADAPQFAIGDTVKVSARIKEGEKEPYFWEVNRAPNYDRFEQVTGINVAEEIVKYLASFLK